MRSLHEEVWRAPRAAILVGAALAIVIAGRAMAWEGHARLALSTTMILRLTCGRSPIA
jgi:hypothetical protein